MRDGIPTIRPPGVTDENPRRRAEENGFGRQKRDLRSMARLLLFGHTKLAAVRIVRGSSANAVGGCGGKCPGRVARAVSMPLCDLNALGGWLRVPDLFRRPGCG